MESAKINQLKRIGRFLLRMVEQMNKSTKKKDNGYVDNFLKDSFIRRIGEVKNVSSLT